MLQPSQDKSKILYDAVSKDYDIGSYDEFSSKLQNPEKRKAFYEGVGKEYALGSYEEFESKVAPLKKKGNSNATAQNQKSASETNTGSLGGKLKFRLPDDSDYNEMQNKGILPPDSEVKKRLSTQKTIDREELLGNQSVKSRVEALPKTTVNTKATETEFKQRGTEKLISDNPDFTEELYNFTTKDKEEIKKGIDLKIENNDLNLDHPYLYFSSYNKKQGELLQPKDEFVNTNFGDDKLSEIGINTADFDGFLNKKGYKAEFLDKEAKGLFDGNGTDLSGGYNIQLAKEIQKERLLNLYMQDINSRDYAKRKLNQEKVNLEKSGADREEWDSQYTLFDSNKVGAFYEKEMPILTQKLKERDAENRKIYDTHKNGDAGFFYGTKQVLKSGWNGFLDRVVQTYSTMLDKIGLDSLADESRFLNEENQIQRPNTRDVGYASGRTTTYDGVKYLVTNDGQIIDQDKKIRVTDLFFKPTYDAIVNKSKSGEEDSVFSFQGSAIQAGGVLGDMIVQVALQRGVGLASGATVKAGSLLSKIPISKSIGSAIIAQSALAGSLLSKIPISKSIGSAIIAQSALGYSQGLEQTYKAAIDAGIDEKTAKVLATDAAQRMAGLYAVTAPISPQTKAIEGIFGSEVKELIKKAIAAYTQTGKKGFIETFKQGGKQLSKNAIIFTEEGGKEVFQENIQQSGESYGVNASINRDAGRELLKETISGDEFVNTSILSFASAGLITLPGMFSSTDKLKTLQQLSKDPIVFEKNLKEMVSKGVFTNDKADILRKDVKIYSNQSHKIPKNLNKDIAMDVMSDLQDISELELKKKGLDKSFHEELDAEIEAKRTSIKSKIKEKSKKQNEQTPPTSETKPQAEVPQQAEAEKVEKTKYRIAELNNELEQNRIRGEKGEISNRSNKEIKAEIAELESKLPKEEVVPTKESNVVEGSVGVGGDVEAKRKETEAKIKRKDLFIGVGEFSSELGGSDKAAVPVSHKEKNGIEFVEYAHPETGSVDVIVTGKSDNDFVGFYRIYENGKPTNKWSSKFENQSRNKEDFKTMISGVQEMLPQGHEYTEKTSISTDGLRVWEQQLSRGYELQTDKNGNVITNEVAINGDAIVNELGIDVNQGNFDNISVTNNQQFQSVKKALLPYLQKFGLNESNIRNVNGTVEIDLPVLRKTKKQNEQTPPTSETKPQAEVPQQAEAEKVELKNEGKADIPTKENINERLRINHPFYEKVSDALNKLGLINKYNPETKEGDVVGGYTQPTSDGGFSVGSFIFSKDGSVSFIKDGARVEFDKNGNVISENTKEVAQEKNKIEIEGTKGSITNLEKTRDSEAFKYKEATETDVLGNRKKVKRLKTAQELKESTDKINATIDKAKSRLTELEKNQPQEVSPVEDVVKPSVDEAETKTVNGKELTFYKLDGYDSNSGFAVEKNKNGYIIHSALLPFSKQKQGIGTDFYVRMNNESIEKTGIPLKSSENLSNSGGKPFWEKLVDKGLAEKTEDGFKFKEQPKVEVNEATPPVEDVVAPSVSKEEYADFIDNNNVSDERLNSIADKVKNQEKLSEQENAIFVGKTSEINKIIADAGKENGNPPTDGNLRVEPTNVGESGTTKQQSSSKESVPSSVERGKSESNTEVSGTDLFPETANIPEISKQVEFNAKNIENKGDSVDKQVSVATKQGQSRPVTDLDIAKSNLKFALKAKEEAEEYLKTTAKNPFADKVQYNKDKLADAKKRIRNLKLEINSLESPTIKEEIAKKVIFKYEGKDVVKVEDITTSKGDKYKKIIFSDEKNQIVSEDKFNSIEKTEIQETPSRKESRKKIAEAKVDDIVNAINGIDSIFGIKIKVDDVDGLNKNGIDIVNVIASIVKQAVNAGIDVDEAIKKTIEHFKKTIDFEVNIDDVKEKLGVEKEISKDELSDFRDLIRDIPQKDEVKNYLSGETIERVHGETRNDQSYNVVSLADLALHGKLVMDKAKELFGDQYVEKTLEFIESANLDADEKAIQYVALENEMDARVSENPNDLGERKLQDLVREKSQAHLRKSAIAINAGRLRAIMKYGIDVNSYPDEILTPKQKQAKNEIEKLVQHSSEDINKEDEIQEAGERVYTQNELNEAIEKARREFEEENLGFEIRESKTKIKKEDALEQIKKIKENWKKASRDGTLSASLPYAKQIIAVTPDVIQLAKLYSQIAGMKTIDIVQAIKNDVSEVFDLIAEKDIKGILKKEYGAKSRKMSEATKRKIYVKLLNKAIESLDAQIEKGSRDFVKKSDKYANDSEIQNLRDLKKQRQEELEKIDPSYSDKKKLSNAIDSVNKSISELENKIADSDFSEKQKEVKEVDKKLAELREKRDSLRKEYNKRKDEYKKSLVSEDEKRKIQESQKITILEKRLQDLKDKKAKDTLGKSSVWNAEISNLQNQIKEEKQRQEEPKKPKIKDVVKQALIDAGFSRTVKIKGEEKTLLDWKKLAGEESSIPKLKANVEKSLKSQGYTNSQISEIGKSLEDEYIRLGADIVEKGLRELENRNKLKPSPSRKTEAKRLSELYNYGLFNGEKATEYDNLLNKTLGLSEFDIETYQKIKSLAKALASVYNQENNGRKLSEIAVQTLNNTINHQIKSLLATSALKSGTKAFNIASAFDDYVGLSMRALLGSVSTLAENKISGEFQVQLQKAFSSGKITPELKKQIEADKKAVFRDITRNAGLFYGDTNTSLTHSSRFEEWLNGKADKAMAHTVVSSFLLRAFLDGVDSSVKVRLTQKAFVKNVIKLLTSETNPNGKMSTEEAIKYVSEQLTGENFEKALKTAKSIIENVNEEQGKKVIKDTDEAIHRFAMDLVKENLLSSDMLTMDNIESAYKSAYKSAGRSIGHEANNIVSAGVNLLSSTLNKRLEKAIQEKNYPLATSLTLLSTIQKSILNPFVGGGTNWVILGLEKSGNPLGYISVIHNATERRKLDLSENKSDITQSLYRESIYKDSAVRLLVGTGLAMAMFTVLTAGDDDEELLGKLNQWLKDNPWAKKHFNKLAPEAVTFLIDMKNGELSKHWQKILGMKNDYFDSTKNLIKTFSDENSSMSGAFGAFVGQNLSSPGPWKTIKDVRDILRGLKGLPEIKTDYKTSSFWNGYFRAGFVDFAKLRPGVNYDLNSKIDKVKDDSKKLNSEIDSFVKKIYDDKLPNDQINKKINELFDKEPLKKEKIINAIKNRAEEEKLKRSGVDPFYIKLKRESNDEIKAILFQDRFKDLSKTTPAEQKEIEKGMNAIGFKGSQEFWNTYWRLAHPENYKNKPIN